MIARSFLDTNVLLYTYDLADQAKRRIAEAVLERLIRSRQGVVSTQVLGEFYAAATRKIRMPPAFAYEQILRFARELQVVDVTREIVIEAARGAVAHRLNFWDAQLWAAARIHQIPVFLTEDLQDGSVLEGVRITNPFRADLLT